MFDDEVYQMEKQGFTFFILFERMFCNDTYKSIKQIEYVF